MFRRNRKKKGVGVRESGRPKGPVFPWVNRRACRIPGRHFSREPNFARVVCSVRSGRKTKTKTKKKRKSNGFRPINIQLPPFIFSFRRPIWLLDIHLFCFPTAGKQRVKKYVTKRRKKLRLARPFVLDLHESRLFGFFLKLFIWFIIFPCHRDSHY